MNYLVAAWGWCWLQVLLVTAVASAMSLVSVRRGAGSAGAIAWLGMAATLDRGGHQSSAV